MCIRDSFQITCDGELVWDRKRDGGFPEAKVLKLSLIHI